MSRVRTLPMVERSHRLAETHVNGPFIRSGCGVAGGHGSPRASSVAGEAGPGAGSVGGRLGRDLPVDYVQAPHLWPDRFEVGAVPRLVVGRRPDAGPPGPATR